MHLSVKYVAQIRETRIVYRNFVAKTEEKVGA